jgi:hypothetical protein
MPAKSLRRGMSGRVTGFEPQPVRPECFYSSRRSVADEVVSKVVVTRYVETVLGRAKSDEHRQRNEQSVALIRRDELAVKHRNWFSGRAALGERAAGE